MPRRRTTEISLYERLDHLLRGAEHPTLLVPAVAADPGSVALLSGPSDPITIAHAALADAAAEVADLVVLVYSVRTLPKEGPVSSPLLSERDRVRTLEAFAQRRDRIVPALASHGLLAEQVDAARSRFPRARLYAVMGSDKALQILDPKWYRDRDAAVERLFAEAEVLYVDREGQEGAVPEVLARSENQRWRARFRQLPSPRRIAAVSSSAVRERIARGEDVTALVPAEVYRFLSTKR